MEVPLRSGNQRRRRFSACFILFTVLIGLPLLLAEFIIGRKHKNAVESYKALAPGKKWHWIGYLGIITCFILLSFYSVVGMDINLHYKRLYRRLIAFFGI